MYVNFPPVLLLKQLSLKHVLGHAGFNVQAALGTGGAWSGSPHWVMATPVSKTEDLIQTSTFYRSVANHVDDDEKRSNFAIMMNALERAAQVQNYQAVLKGTTVSVKIAHKFKYAKSNQCIWELKQGKKDRVYFFSTTLHLGTTNCAAIVPLMAFHKKDQNTPREVINYCEPAYRSYLAAGNKIQLLMERS